MFNRNSFGKPTVIYILSTLAVVSLIFLGVKEFQNAEVSIKKIFIPSLCFKLVCGIGVGLLYSHYYDGGDTFAYFEDGKQIAQLAETDRIQFLQFLWNGNPAFEIWNTLNFTQPRALFFSKLTAVGYLISFGHYWGVALMFSFLSFLTTWRLVQKIVRYFPTTREAAVLAFLIFPSVVFWTAGLMKETVAMSGLFAVVYVFINFWVRKKISLIDGLVLVLGFWVLWNLKYYYAGVLLISMGAMLLGQIIRKQFPTLGKAKIALVFFLLLLISVWGVTHLHPNFYVSRFLEVVLKNYEAYRAISEPGNLIAYYRLEATPLSVLINTPWALISGLFRPFIWESSSALHFITGVETLLVLILFINAIRNRKKINVKPEVLVLIGMFIYITVLAIFLALSTPNMGTLVRYRVGYYPFFVFILLLANPWITKRNRFLST